MTYADVQDFNGRYTTKLGDAEISSHFLFYATSRLDAMLAPYFTVPFSSNNLVARDLTIDLAYLMVLQRSKDSKDYEALKQKTEERIKALADGSEAMMTTSGGSLYSNSAGGGVWSNTSGGQTLFNLDDHLLAWPGVSSGGSLT